MCMTFAASALGTSIIASDQRHGIKLKNGQRITADYGGKLVRIPACWLALTGDALVCDTILQHLQDHMLADLGAFTFSAGTAKPSFIERARERWPGYPSDGVAFILATSGPAVVAMDGTGKVLKKSTDGAIITSYPVGITGRTPVPLPSAQSRFDMVRMVAAEFAAVSLLSETVSPTIEIGIGDDSYTIGQANELAQMSDAQLAALVQRPPAPRFDAFRQIIEEYIAQ